MPMRLRTPTGYQQRGMKDEIIQALIKEFLRVGQTIHSGEAQTAQYIINYCLKNRIDARVEIFSTGGTPACLRISNTSMPSIMPSSKDQCSISIHPLSDFQPPKVQMRFDDPLGRFTAGEVGQLEPHDSDKYDHFVTFPGAVSRGPLFGGDEPITQARAYYFYSHEIAPTPTAIDHESLTRPERRRPQ